MEYPDYLVPTTNDGIIGPLVSLEELCFARRANRAGTIVDTSGKRVLQDAVLGQGQSGQMQELSINLLGQHTEDDCFWRIQNSGQRYFDLWVPGNPGLCPQSDELSVFSREEYGTVYFLFGREDIPFPITEGNNDCHATINHRPTNCNYWHFQFEVSFTNGETLARNPKWRDRLLKRLLGIMLEAWAYSVPPKDFDFMMPLGYRQAAQSIA